jgi:anti-anti-sigma factor
MQNVLIRPQGSSSKNAQVIQPAGALNADTANQFQAQLNDAVQSEQHSGLLIDMGLVESIDSAGLMVLVSALKSAQELGKQFHLCSVSFPIRMVLELTQLDRVFEILETRSVY